MNNDYTLPIRITNPEGLLDLEEDCRICYGSGLNPKYKKPRMCDYCEGAKQVLTPMGEKLLEFINKYK